MAQIYLSWDVGIANLAYCLIEKIDEKLAKFKIIKWGIINLKAPPSICQDITNNKICQRNATFYSNDGTNTYYCKVHAKKYIPQQIKFVQCLNTDKCVHMINNIAKNTTSLCDKKATQSIDLKGINYPYCKTHCDVHTKHITKDNSLKKINTVNANKIPMQTLSIKLFELLNKMPEFVDVHEVLIENQPVQKNATMKTIQCLLFSYFVMKGMVDDKKITNVKFICPSNKLKVGSDADLKLKNIKQEGGDDRKVYNITKKLGIKFCKELIKDDKKNLEFINKQKKQDDYCDAFLQAYYYMFCRNGVPKNVQEILNKLVAEEGDIDVCDKAIDLSDLIVYI